MSDLKKIFKKQGGLKLLKQYFISGCFFTALLEFLILGKEKTSLEILRLATQQKIKKTLLRKYYKYLISFDKNYKELPHNNSNIIWVCWFQGMENAPTIVKKCYESMKNIKNKEVILITKENLKDFVDFPNYIIEKWNKGIITNTHMTDLLRLELLIKYGGIWLDATVLCTNNEIPSYIDKSDLFFYQTLKPGKDGHATYISSWFMKANSNNKILLATQNLCYNYWKNKNFMIDYFLFHHFFSIVLDFYKEDWNNVLPISNSTPHILLLRLFEEYDKKTWDFITSQTSFHKLSYKFDSEQLMKRNTFYQRIINERINI